MNDHTTVYTAGRRVGVIERSLKHPGRWWARGKLHRARLRGRTFDTYEQALAFARAARPASPPA